MKGCHMMRQYTQSNRELWNRLTALNAESRFYDVESFRQGRCSLKSIELQEVGDVKDKRLLHLQCHFGLDTISWSRLGAKATGVDFSETGIEFAQELAKRVGTDTRFICILAFVSDFLKSKK